MKTAEELAAQADKLTDTQKVINFLEQAKKLDALIKNKREEERELWSLATSMTQNSDGMPRGSNNNDKMTNIVAKLINKQEEINLIIDKYIDTKQEVVDCVEKLPRKQYEVLYWLYIKKHTKREKGQKMY